MALRNIVIIDEQKCNGCGLCVTACAEGAIEIIDGKAKLVSEIYCDGLGACLGHCPEDAITVEQREAPAFDKEATKQHLAEEKKPQPDAGFLCPGMMAQKLMEKGQNTEGGPPAEAPSQLSHWPVQLKLVSPQAPYFANADLLLVADCVPFAMGDFHSRLLKDRSIAIGCPKLDDTAFYIDKLAEILSVAALNSLTVVHMEVPCCSGLTNIAKQALAKTPTLQTFKDITIDLRGNLTKTETIKSR